MANDEKPTEPSFIYDAFISYRHVERDSKWAKWLIGALENYRVPNELQKRGFPPRLRKIFRDEDEVPASGDLNDQIRQALVASRFLIVVCSPYTPRSIWVQREIEMFNELGRGDQVLALLTEGEPSDSFPNPMLERHRTVENADGTTRIVKEAKEPLAADVRRHPGISMDRQRYSAVLRLVAVILGVHYDDLYQRERQRARRRVITWAATFASLALVIALGTFAYWEMTRPTIAYYRDIIFRWEAPEGLNLIDEPTRQRLQSSYRVVTRDKKVVEVRHENSEGTLIGSPARWVMHYRNDGSLERGDFFDATDRLIYEESYDRDPASNRLVVNFRHGVTPVTLDALEKNLFANNSLGSTKGNAEITRQDLTFNDDGYVIGRRYQDYFGAPRQNAAGSFGQTFQYNPAGLVTRSAEVGADGSETALKAGAFAATISYDRNNRRVRRTTLDANGKLTGTQDGIAVEAWEYNADGNLAMASYFGVDGKPTARRAGCAKDQFTYDGRGNLIEQICLTADSIPTASKDGFAKLIHHYDIHGYPTETAYFNADGKSASGADGCAKMARSFDNHGHVTQQDCFGSDGNPAPSRSGSARVKSSYDDHGNLREASSFSADGIPTLAVPNNCARITNDFDAQDRRTTWTCYGVDGNAALSVQKVAKVTYSYDTRGNLTAEDYFDEGGKPTAFTSCACAGYRLVFDRNGNLVETRYVDANGKPSSGIDRSVSHYDEKGNPIAVEHFAVDGKLILHRNGFAKITADYDARGNQTRMAYFGVDGMPIVPPLVGFAGVNFAFDSRGKEVSRAFFGVDGKPILAPEGYALFTSAYDVRGNLIEQAVFDKDNKPTLNLQGFAAFRQTFDDSNQPVETSYYGTDNKLIVIKNGYAGYRLSYDDRGQPIEKAYFGADHKPIAVNGIARLVSRYDARRNLIERVTYGIDGKPAPFVSDVARITWVFDDWGQESEARYFDPSGREIPASVVIAGVLPGTVAEKINLVAGDRILTYGGRKITSTQQLIDATTDPRLGAKRRLAIVRGSQSFTFDVPAGRLGISPDLVLDRQ